MTRIHSHWHVNIQAAGTCSRGAGTHLTWNTSWTQNRYSHFGLKAAAGFARSARGPGWQGRASTDSCSGASPPLLFLKRGARWQNRGSGDHPGVDVMAAMGRQLHRGTILPVHRPALAKDSPHEETRERHHLERDGHGNPR